MKNTFIKNVNLTRWPRKKKGWHSTTLKDLPNYLASVGFKLDKLEESEELTTAIQDLEEGVFILNNLEI